MAAPSSHRLLAAWAPPEFAAAVTLLAEARGQSRSEFLRAALTRHALAVRRPQPPEVRAKISAGNRGKTLSPEHRAAISAAARRDAATPTVCPGCGRACRGKRGLAVHENYCKGRP